MFDATEELCTLIKSGSGSDRTNEKRGTFLAFQMNNLLQGLNQFVNQEQDQNFCLDNNVDQQQLQQQLLIFQQHHHQQQKQQQQHQHQQFIAKNTFKKFLNKHFL